MSYKHDTCLDNAPGRKGLGISRTGTTFNQSQARRRRKLKKKRRKKNAHTRHNKSKQDANILKSPVSKQLSSVRPSFSLSRSLSPPSLSRSHSPLPLSLLPPFPLSPSLSLSLSPLYLLCGQQHPQSSWVGSPPLSLYAPGSPLYTSTAYVVRYTPEATTASAIKLGRQSTTISRGGHPHFSIPV